MGSKSARLRKRRELMARRKAAEAKKTRLEAEEARRAALKTATGDVAETTGSGSGDAKTAAAGSEDTEHGMEVEVDETSRLFKRKVKARKTVSTVASIHESAETLKKTDAKTIDAPEPTRPVKEKTRKIVAKVVAVIAAVATLGSVVIAAFYAD